jgi:hypothetical protein
MRTYFLVQLRGSIFQETALKETSLEFKKNRPFAVPMYAGLTVLGLLLDAETVVGTA